MLTEIRKVLTSLGCLCVILVVVEELFQQMKTEGHRRGSQHWSPDMQTVTLVPALLSTTTKGRIVNHFLRGAVQELSLDEGDGRGGLDEGDGRRGLDEGDGRRGLDEGDGRGGLDEGDGRGGLDEGDGRSGLDEGDGRSGLDEGDGRSGVDERDGRSGLDEGDGRRGLEIAEVNKPISVKKKLLSRLKIVQEPTDGDKNMDLEVERNNIAVTMLATSDIKKAVSTEHDDDENRRLSMSPFIYPEKPDRSLAPPADRTSHKLISYFLPWDLDRHQLRRFTGCPYDNCGYVNNMSEAEAILFRASQIRDHIIPNFYRPKGQRWIFFTNDPSVKQYALDRPDVKSNFNWTITYQLDSDFPMLFGHLRRRPPRLRDYEAVYERKDREAAWFVSHCPTWSRREQYVQRMAQVMQVDIFGKCGNLTCGPIHYRGKDSTECLPMLTQHYKFYLAFENSFCRDYISEKFFKLFQDVDVVPVVRGGFNYKKYLPSGIFVDASDFKTPEALSQHLLQLGNNKNAYISMLKKKSQWVESSPMPFQCVVCQALQTTDDKPHFYQNLKVKFNGEPSNCWPPTDLS